MPINDHERLVIDKVHVIWSGIAASLVSVNPRIPDEATSPANETLNYQNVICLRMPDLYDKNAVTDALCSRCYIFSSVDPPTDHESLESKHPSGVPASIADSYPAQELKDAYFAEAHAATTSAAKVEEKKDKLTADTRINSVRKKKAPEDDPFSSEGKDDADEVERKRYGWSQSHNTGSEHLLFKKLPQV
ncbi:hypothetical protein K503DRAFT_788417 [Rhizopogon vinicolor AM-OR11-026]|uniref:Uncharacterized protein n=1 Tax=Rhizopogon vinicolor AM-OR11-026 TaxID=1314800 RepID=A0A1B7MD08_9AGAM|nr:hypothetical protein K503DRAFT_788417 [Rhizopogon vinicolor AM-OR11-026]